MSDDIHIDERLVEAIQGDPERTICLVVTPDRPLSMQGQENVRRALSRAFAGTKWEGIKMLLVDPGWTVQAIELPKAEVEKVESWRDREAML